MAIIAKKKLSEKVVDEIRQRVEDGELSIGDKLPNQNRLAMELGVSRTSLREAMNILSLLGVIEQRPGFGTVIRKKVPHINPEGLKPTLLADEQTTRELLDARLIIEAGTAQIAATRATEKQVKALGEIVAQMQIHLDNGEYREYAQMDLKFHTRIAELSNNRFLNDAFVSIRQHMQIFMHEHTTLQPDVLENSQKYHAAICESIMKHQSDQATKHMKAHLINLQGSFSYYKK